jgi:predicted phosphoadenosine phosphosulfate sulfurtransferase
MEYKQKWSKCGYFNDIPDECPHELEVENLVPSYRLIAKCLLKNDLNLTGLGFVQQKSAWYDALKKIELKKRGVIIDERQMFFKY